MRPKYFLIIIVFAVIVVAFYQLINAGSDLPDANPTIVPAAVALPSQGEGFKMQVKSRITPAATVDLVAATVVTTDDGPTLLQNQCAKCHAVHLLQLTKKDKVAWEKTLSSMERLGVSLSDAETSVLIDYLAVSDD